MLDPFVDREIDLAKLGLQVRELLTEPTLGNRLSPYGLLELIERRPNGRVVVCGCGCDAWALCLVSKVPKEQQR